jgi:hypothetical protein
MHVYAVFTLLITWISVSEVPGLVWGYVSQGDAAVAAYFVEWTPGQSGRSWQRDPDLGRRANS